MSTHDPGFHTFFRFFASFCSGQISHHQHNKGELTWKRRAGRDSGMGLASFP